MTAMMWEPTRAGSDRNTKMLTLDSGTFFLGQPDATASSYEITLENPVVINNPAKIYLEGVYIGGFKLSALEGTAFPGVSAALNTSVVTHFNIDIPEFDINSFAGSASSDGAHAFNGKFTLPNEKAISKAAAGAANTDYKPFIKAYLSRTAVYVSSIKPTTLNNVHVNITYQNGDSIFLGTGGPTGSSGENPPKDSRRIVLQFIIAEES